MLVRREGETFDALLRRLDKAIATVRDGGDPIDEINGCGRADVRVKMAWLAAFAFSTNRPRTVPERRVFLLHGAK